MNPQPAVSALDRRRAALRHLLEIYREPDDDLVHEVPIWEAWLERTGELPPDFSALPSRAGLPDLLTCQDGTAVQNGEDWGKRREEIFAILREYQLGTPPHPFAWAAHVVKKEVDAASSHTCLKVDLLLGPSQDAVEKLAYTGPASYQAAYLKLEIYLPGGAGPFPALVGPDFRKYAGQRGSWRVPPAREGLSVYERALRRGYITCTYDPNDAFACRSVFPRADCTEVAWWSWAAGRAVDYLWTLPELDRSRIATAGHSRGGTAALAAAVLDDRITAVVASHCGAGGTVPYRACAEKFGSQTLEVHTRFFPYVSHPRLRFFCGRENKLPFDTHFLTSLVAPRPLLIKAGYHDPVGQLSGGQLLYEAVRQVYTLLGAPQRLAYGIDPGGHSLAENAPDEWLDWIDLQFGRQAGEYHTVLPYDYHFSAWREATGEQINPLDWPEYHPGKPITAVDELPRIRQGVLQQMTWLLGDLPERRLPDRIDLKPVTVFDRNYSFRADSGLTTHSLSIDGSLVLYLTCQERALLASERLPVAIYCHAYCDQRGLAWERHESYGLSVGERLARAGFLAVQFDLFGYGRRNREPNLAYFCAHPGRSALGVMVQDVRTILDLLPRLPFADPARVSVVGYSLGGLVGLFSAALDERIQALAAVCALGSWRRDAHAGQTEGLGRYCLRRPTLPRLGFFINEESRLPIDEGDVLALVAPRPAWVVAPLLDQDWVPEDTRAVVQDARIAYHLLDAPHNLRFSQPDDFNRYPPRLQDEVIRWLKGALMPAALAAKI